MINLLEFVIGGLLLGGVYGLIALPISMVHSTTHSLDAAVGGHAGVAAATAAGVGGVAGITAGIGVGALSAAVAGLIYLGLRYTGHSDPITFVLATFGLAMALQAAVLMVHGRDPITAHGFSGTFQFSGILVRYQSLLNLMIGIIAVVALTLVLQHSSAGRSLRACADNVVGAQLAGLRVALLQFLAIFVGGLLAAVAGVLLLYSAGLTYMSGLHLTLAAIGAAVLFGLRGPVHGFAGALLYGLVEALVYGYTSSGVAATIPLLFIFVVLALGRSTIETGRP